MTARVSCWLPFPDCPAAGNDPGPNTWPDSAALPGFRPVVKELTSAYHSLTHELGHLICESLGEDPANFDAVSSLVVTYVNVSMHHQLLLRRD
jgi:isopenicillin N synthase-like dioxygenase